MWSPAGHLAQPVAEVLAYLHVQISAVSCNVVGPILHVLGKNTDTANEGYRWTGWGDTTHCTVTWCKKVLGALLASSYCKGFQNIVVRCIVGNSSGPPEEFCEIVYIASIYDVFSCNINV